jgi:hypothetical protein
MFIALLQCISVSWSRGIAAKKRFELPQTPVRGKIFVAIERDWTWSIPPNREFLHTLQDIARRAKYVCEELSLRRLKVGDERFP